MTNIEIKKHGIFDKNRRDKKEINVAYQTIGDYRSSLDGSSIIMSIDDHNIDDASHINTTVNLKKSKTFKIIVNKKIKEKEKSSKCDNFKKPKSKKRKRKEIKNDSLIIESVKDKESIRPIFGVSLQEACKNSKSYDGYPLPAFFRQCINYLETENRLSFEGIYRIPGVNSQIVKLKQSLISYSDIDILLSNFDISVITSTVKSFLRDLNHEIITKPVEELIFKTLEQHKDNLQEKINSIKSIISEKLPIECQYVLALLTNHMGKITDMSNQNKMTLENLLIVLSPCLHLHFGILKLFYDYSSDLFADMQVPVYVPPIRPGPEHEEELPETVEGINEELKKQISFLDDLHDQITEGFETEKTEYLIWEVQLIVTKLKRKKYIMELNDPELIRVELKKYERHLEKLHKDMLDAAASNTAVSNSTGGSISVTVPNVNVDQPNVGSFSTMDQELWQVQRTITTLNRKLKALTTNTPSKPQTESIVSMTPNQKGDIMHDDDDDDSVQLNLTLRKLPADTPEMMDDDVGSESDKEISVNKETLSEKNTNSVVEPKDTDGFVEEIMPDEVIKTSEEKTSDWLSREHDQQQQHEGTFDKLSDQSVDENHLTVCIVENEPSVSSNGIIHTTESNSESEMTGSNMATCIEDLIQTGEMWTNEKEQLLSEDDDFRNEALRYLYMREELISIKNDLKTRLSSEANEISRLKRNIENLEEMKVQKNFSSHNQYRKLNESSSTLDKEECEGDDDEDIEGGCTEEEEDDCDESSRDSDSMQYSEQILAVRTSENGQEDIADLLRQQQEIILDNERLEKDNMELLEKIQLERNHCLELKVALRTHMLLTCPSPWPNLDE